MEPAAKRILIVEDDAHIAELMRMHLQDEGYAITHAADGDAGLRELERGQWDALVLDLMLPGVDGLEICRRARAMTRYTPIIITSARSSEVHRILGLELGADDYLVKPFSFVELVLRIRTLLRRGVVREAETYEFADLRLDVLRRKASREGREIALTNKEFLLLHLLIKRQGEALSRTLIASEVWDMNFDSDTNVVDVAIKRLRAKVDQPFAKKLIHTVRSIGYTFGDSP